mmetsp:Transcript_1790/g.4939  ORF Transcript_1790/g.4939 Transcript_1790/m.4939 type:complete len:178 (+) Transcript_1790:704-1237(+)
MDFMPARVRSGTLVPDRLTEPPAAMARSGTLAPDTFTEPPVPSPRSHAFVSDKLTDTQAAIFRSALAPDEFTDPQEEICRSATFVPDRPTDAHAEIGRVGQGSVRPLRAHGSALSDLDSGRSPEEDEARFLKHQGFGLVPASGHLAASSAIMSSLAKEFVGRVAYVAPSKPARITGA